ncbi:hypothetical protein [Leucobacter luti]|uniref:hypothetical protein n=1 Tax=Leucobacter luti TaxID=340320 RepID=UPI0010EDADB5|nr:hypothetical protein [Leucobacter luti]MCW2289356.1 hypothetical protein [Leucobacter luti]QYM74854.1 hypothetical protein K1X41_08980 [Leucobacter luti]TCK39916.1 hypothetical protein EDF60_2375 [Leucobacter luti]
MFSILWRFFPGPAWLRVIVLLAVAAVAVYAVITFVYPWVALQLPAPEVTVGT